MRPGDVILGKYEIERELGAGGMGRVLAARHRDLDERVAIKVLLSDSAGHAETVARFMREAKAATRIKNEHVARVMDVGRLPSGEPYMVMEYLEGQDLDRVLKERGPLPIAEAVDYVLQAIEAVAEAHVIGIVHRDLKPANIFVTKRRDGSPWIKVIDFGISKFTAEATTGGGMTKTQGMMGSPLYMSPEHLQSAKDVDVRTDVWAFGVILFQLITGTFPFVADTMPQLLVQVFQAPPQDLRSFRPDAPIAFADIVYRCLQKDRNARYPNVAELAVELQAFASKRGRQAVDRICRIMPVASFEGETSEYRAAVSAPEPPRVSSPMAVLPTQPANLANAQTDAPWGRTAPEHATDLRTARSVTPMHIGIAALIASAIIGTGIAIRVSHVDRAPAAPEEPLVQPMKPRPREIEEPKPIAAPQPSESAAPVSSPAPSSPKPPPGVGPKGGSPPKSSTNAAITAPPSPTITVTATATTQPAASPPPPAPPKSTCTPPYYYDEEGIKHHKPGCD